MEDNYLYIGCFQTNKFNTETINLIKKVQEINNVTIISATGGGAFKFSNLVNEELKIKIDKHDEVLSLLKGYSMMNNYNTFYEISNGVSSYLPIDDFEYPHIAVNVGSGVSVLRVNSISDIKRITGTLMGGG